MMFREIGGKVYARLKQGDRFYICLNGLIVVAAFSIILLHTVPQLRRFSLAKFHCIADSYPAWSAAQLLPAMYNYENRVRLQELNEGVEVGDPFPAETRYHPLTWRNHYPMQHVTAPVSSVCAVRPLRLVLQSEFQNDRLVTVYHCTPKSDRGYAIEVAHKKFVTILPDGN